jgi:hypothetical protein
MKYLVGLLYLAIMSQLLIYATTYSPEMEQQLAYEHFLDMVAGDQQ